MTGRVLDFEELSTEMDVLAAEEFVAAHVGRQLGTLEDGGEEVAAALDAEGLHEAAEAMRRACANPLDLTDPLQSVKGVYTTKDNYGYVVLK